MNIGTYDYKNLTEDKVYNSDVLFCYIEKREVLNKDFTKINNILQTLQNCKTNAKQKLQICFTGYEFVKKEIYEIDEIKKYVKLLFDKYPHIFYFITNYQYYNNTILACIGNTKKELISICNIPLYTLNIDLADTEKQRISKSVINYGESIGDNIFNIKKIFSGTILQ